MFDEKSTEDLRQLIRDARIEIKKREEGPKKPVYVISEGDTNQCFKNKEEAINEANDDLFFHGDTEETFHEAKRCSVRWIPEKDYDEMCNSWFEA